jgi:hypothetical protein
MMRITSKSQLHEELAIRREVVIVTNQRVKDVMLMAYVAWEYPNLVSVLDDKMTTEDGRSIMFLPDKYRSLPFEAGTTILYEPFEASGSTIRTVTTKRELMHLVTTERSVRIASPIDLRTEIHLFWGSPTLTVTSKGMIQAFDGRSATFYSMDTDAAGVIHYVPQ